MNQNIQLIVLVAGTIIPTMIGLITSRDASVVLQNAIGATISVMVGLVSTWSYTAHFNWVTAAIATLTTFISTVVMAHAFYHPTGVTKKLQALSPINIGSSS